MTFDFQNADMIERTGFSGWLNTDTKKVILCARMNHLDMITKSGSTYYDGTPMEGYLDGIDGSKIDNLPSEGGPSGCSWAELRVWCAKQGWVHFVTNDEDTMIYFLVATPEQIAVCKAFSREAGIQAFFKGAIHDRG